jgi:TPR repeat protein
MGQKIIVGVLCYFSALGGTHASQLDDALVASLLGDYKRAIALVRPLAEQGNPKAESILGEMYLHGEGLAQDFGLAASWIQKAAEQGDEISEKEIGVMYYTGQGVPQDYLKAFAWTFKSAEKGYVEAQYNLAVMYHVGQGVVQDYRMAFNWYKRAADRGHESAQYNLGILYFNGRGVPQNFVLAHMWFNIAASSATDSDIRDKSSKNRDIVALKMTGDQVAQAQELAANWKAEHPYVTDPFTENPTAPAASLSGESKLYKDIPAVAPKKE